MTRRAIAGILLVCAAAFTTYAAVPTSMTVQGKLTDASGNPLPAGPKNFTFKIFDAAVGGGQFWPDAGGENQVITTATDGTWVGLVGAVIPILSDAFADTSRWLEITVDGTTLPRVRLVTGPYAYRVGTVDGASGGKITSKLSIGPGHTNSGIDAFVAGNSNSVTSGGATVSGGANNSVSGFAGAIGGGQLNRVGANYGTVGGGYADAAAGIGSAVAGGEANAALGDYATIGGGQQNRATQLETTIGGGSDNRASGVASTIGGGRGDTALGSFSTIGGGIRNWCFGQSTTIGGGSENRTDADYATIGGGLRNYAAFASTVGGGQSNLATATNGATIAGGTSNMADGSFSTIGGGYNNYTYGTSATVSGGGGSADADSNVARGLGATIPGGRRNRANGSFSFAAGRRAHALHHGTFVWADSTEADFISTAQDQFLIRASGGVGIGTNAPEGPWHVQKGSAGAVTANSNSIAVFETSAGNGWLSILGPDNTERGLLFTEPSNAVAGAIVFDQGGGGNDIGFRTGGNVTNMTLDASGNLTVSGCVDGNNTACASDERFKTNIATVDDALAIVGRLRGVRYQWRTNEFPERHFELGAQYGVIAQEVHEVLPELIRKREDGYLSVEYNGLIPLLIEGMKEQQRQIDELKAALRARTP